MPPIDFTSFIWQGGTIIWQEGTFILRRITIFYKLLEGWNFDHVYEPLTLLEAWSQWVGCRTPKYLTVLFNQYWLNSTTFLTVLIIKQYWLKTVLLIFWARVFLWFENGIIILVVGRPSDSSNLSICSKTSWWILLSKSFPISKTVLFNKQYCLLISTV